MPHRRKPEKGSFGGHFDELITQFSAGEAAASRERERAKRSRELQDKIDVHAALFERAWRVDGKR